jgi:hypothetical protein
MLRLITGEMKLSHMNQDSRANHWMNQKQKGLTMEIGPKERMAGTMTVDSHHMPFALFELSFP